MRLTAPLLPKRSWAMTVFRAEMEVGDSQGQRWEGVEALVDTGSSYSSLPQDLLQRLGVAPYDRRQFELADESVIERDIGQTWVRAAGQAAIRIVIFAREGEMPLMGADTLEGLGLGVDPVNGRLIPVRALLKPQGSRE